MRTKLREVVRLTHLICTSPSRCEVVDGLAKVHKLVEGVRADGAENFLNFLLLRGLTGQIVLQHDQTLRNTHDRTE
jgi:hypothetical protein